MPLLDVNMLSYDFQCVLESAFSEHDWRTVNKRNEIEIKGLKNHTKL